MSRDSGFKQYKLIELIGRGGMGEVWLARHEMLDREVAIKLIRPGAESGGEGALRRFEREARATSGLHSPHTVQIYDFGITDEGVFFTVMELLHGLDLRTFVEQHGPPQAERAVYILRQVCDSLAEAHYNGLIHRDIKPANIFLCQLGLSYDFVKVLDFGLVKTTQSSKRDVEISAADRTVGTPAFMPPEIATGSVNVDSRADLYSLGCVAYYLLTGMPVFEGDSPVQVMAAHLEHEPEPPSIRSGQVFPKKLERVIMDCLEKKPDDRPQSAREVTERLARISFEEPWTEERSERWWRMHRPLWLVREPREAASSPKHDVPVSRSARSPLQRSAVALLLAAAAGAMLATFVMRGQEKEVAASASAPASQVKATSEPIQFGMSAAFTGPSRETGRSVRVGASAHLRSVNDAGGLSGRALELVALDDGYRPERAHANMLELLGKRKVFAAIGSVGDATIEKAVSLALRSRTPFIGAVSGLGLLRKEPPDRYVFNFRPGYLQETAALVGYLVKGLKLAPEQIAVFAQDDIFGEDAYRGVLKALKTRGLLDEKMVLRIGYQSDGSQVEKAARTVAKSRESAAAVIVLAGYRPAARFIKAVERSGLDPVFALLSSVDGEALAEELKELGSKRERRIIATQVVPDPLSSSTGVLRYRRQLKKYFPEERPGHASLEGYVVASIVTEALRRAVPPVTRERLVDALESIRDLDLGIGSNISFGPSDHQGSDVVWGARLDAQGRFRHLDLE